VNHANPSIIAREALILAGSITLLGGIVWSIWIVRVFRREKRWLQHGLCLRCGYDLRHSNDRCPECGEPIRRSKK
jgi:hypothetical protein